MKIQELIDKQSECLKQILILSNKIRDKIREDAEEDASELGFCVTGAIKMISDCATEYLKYAKPVCCFDNIEDEQEL